MRLLTLVLIAALLPAQTVIGHRGCRAKRPENTIAAFRTAIADGIQVLETDTVLTKDNRVVLNHDIDINPDTCDVQSKIPVRTLTIAEIQAIDCGTKIHPKFLNQIPAPGSRIPALEELFELTAGTNVELMIETKMAPEDSPAAFAKAIHAIIERYQAAGRVILQSFDHRTLAEMKRLNPTVRLCMLNPHQQRPDWVTPAKALGAHIQFINYRVITRENVESLHKAGLKVYSGTTDDPAEWRKLIALQVDAILTDNPAALRALLASAPQ
jgi:glycerophosphoryl diester phosphodiesterase